MRRNAQGISMMLVSVDLAVNLDRNIEHFRIALIVSNTISSVILLTFILLMSPICSVSSATSSCLVASFATGRSSVSLSIPASNVIRVLGRIMNIFALGVFEPYDVLPI